MEMSSAATFVGGAMFTLGLGIATNLLTPVLVNRWRVWRAGATQSQAASLREAIKHQIAVQAQPERAIASLIYLASLGILMSIAFVLLALFTMPEIGAKGDWIRDGVRFATGVPLMAGPVGISVLLGRAADEIIYPEGRLSKLRAKATKLGLDFESELQAAHAEFASDG